YLVLRRGASRSTLFPYTTLFRSEIGRLAVEKGWVQPWIPEQETAFSDTGLYILATINNGPNGRSYLPHKVPDCIYHLPNPKQRRSEEHTSELQSRENLVCRLLLD